MPATACRKWWSGSPNRRPSSSAIGRAPIATMSRRIPPTPVAAPWKGSTAEGWLCDSTLNATATPSPRSITPAFSPGPWRTRSPRDGRRRRSGAECLYPQCSDQSSEKTASSKSFGVRLSSSRMRSNSPSVRPRERCNGWSATAARGPGYPASRMALVELVQERTLGDGWLEVSRRILELGADEAYDGAVTKELALVTLVVDEPDPADELIASL